MSSTAPLQNFLMFAVDSRFQQLKAMTQYVANGDYSSYTNHAKLCNCDVDLSDYMMEKIISKDANIIAVTKELNNLFSSLEGAALIQNYTFAVHRKLRYLLSKIGIDSHMKHLMVTMTKIFIDHGWVPIIGGTAQESDEVPLVCPNSVEVGMFDNWSVIMCAAASSAFPGVFVPPRVMNTASFVDGGVMDNDPSSLARPLNKHGKVLSLRLSGLGESSPAWTKYNIVEGVIENIIEESTDDEYDVDIEPNDHYYKIKKDATNQAIEAKEILEVMVAPDASIVDTFSYDVSAANIKATTDYASNEMIKKLPDWDIIKKTTVESLSAETTTLFGLRMTDMHRIIDL